MPLSVFVVFEAQEFLGSVFWILQGVLEVFEELGDAHHWAAQH